MQYIVSMSFISAENNFGRNFNIKETVDAHNYLNAINNMFLLRSPSSSSSLGAGKLEIVVENFNR